MKDIINFGANTETEATTNAITQTIVGFAKFLPRKTLVGGLIDTWLVNQGNQILGSHQREPYYAFNGRGLDKAAGLYAYTKEANNECLLRLLMQISDSKFVFTGLNKPVAKILLNSIAKHIQ